MDEVLGASADVGGDDFRGVNALFWRWEYILFYYSHPSPTTAECGGLDALGNTLPDSQGCAYV
jgi:hypothetical protein